MTTEENKKFCLQLLRIIKKRRAKWSWLWLLEYYKPKK